MSALPSFHTKAVAEKQAEKEALVDNRNRAHEFLMVLDELLDDESEEVIEAR